MAFPVNYQSIIAQLDSVLGEYKRATTSSEADTDISLDDEELRTLLTRSVAAIERAAPPGSVYERDAKTEITTTWAPDRLRGLIGVVRALREDYVGGYMQRVVELIHAGLFDDFLDMAGELLAKGYKDPAAVIGGSVLEEHLRKLANRANVAPSSAGKPIKADRLNADLVKAGVYNLLEQKNVTAWLDLRNKAAHGEFTAYDEAHVDLTLQSVRSFVARYPA